MSEEERKGEGEDLELPEGLQVLCGGDVSEEVSEELDETPRFSNLASRTPSCCCLASLLPSKCATPKMDPQRLQQPGEWLCVFMVALSSRRSRVQREARGERGREVGRVWGKACIACHGY